MAEGCSKLGLSLLLSFCSVCSSDCPGVCLQLIPPKESKTESQSETNKSCFGRRGLLAETLMRCLQKAEKPEPKDEKMAEADAPTEAPAEPEAAAEGAAASESEPMDSSS